MNSILFVDFWFWLRKNQNRLFCNEYSILSHSVAISSCRSLSFFSLSLKLELFKNNALINSAFVKGILPILIRVKMEMESSSLLKYQITLELNLILDLNAPLSKSSICFSNHLQMVS